MQWGRPAGGGGAAHQPRSTFQTAFKKRRERNQAQSLITSGFSKKCPWIPCQARQPGHGARGRQGRQCPSGAISANSVTGQEPWAGPPAAGAHGQGAFQSSSETRRLRAGAGRIGPLSGLAGGAEPHLAFPSDHQAVALRTQATLASGLCRCGLEAAPALRPPPSGSYVHQTDRWPCFSVLLASAWPRECRTRSGGVPVCPAWAVLPGVTDAQLTAHRCVT